MASPSDAFMPHDHFIPFELERWQSTWENQVRVNLSESGVHPLSVAELLALADTPAEELLSQRLVYNQSDGTIELREAVAARYAGTAADHVTITVGSSEANFVVCWTLIRPGDRVVVVTPTYMQTHGLAQNFGAHVEELWLHSDRGWQLDPDEIVRTVTPDTRLVVVTNPNNPSGQVLSNEGREALLERVRDTGAWLLADEVYQGAELGGVETPSFWGSYDRAIVVNGLSKAYGLPGLRIGWIVSSPEMKASFFERHDYTVIGPSSVSDLLARKALAVRDRILARTRGILQTNWTVLERWLGGFDGLFRWCAPACGAICLTRYNHPTVGLELAERVRTEVSVLLEPGEHFGLPGHLRMGYGNETSELEKALELLTPTFRAMAG
jgi:aspartate/methionine/tyrosine aminotransferase